MNRRQLIEEIKDTQRGITKVKDKYVSEENLELNYITIFSHDQNEFEELTKTAEKIGEKISKHNGPIFKLKKNLKFDNGTLKIFRIRKPDTERPQKGCGDFKVSNYKKFKDKYLQKNNFLLFKGNGYEFLGIHDLKEDYLVYFPDKPLTEEFGI
ncbi:hypothetical protein HY449_00085 [Candidatus Pacearchaeota archaeon]|nr:hypothetical protein [Candidatus Pacearchaeota archaeon]